MATVPMPTTRHPRKTGRLSSHRISTVPTSPSTLFTSAGSEFSKNSTTSRSMPSRAVRVDVSLSSSAPTISPPRRT